PSRRWPLSQQRTGTYGAFCPADERAQVGRTVLEEGSPGRSLGEGLSVQVSRRARRIRSLLPRQGWTAGRQWRSRGRDQLVNGGAGALPGPWLGGRQCRERARGRGA